MFHYKIMGLKYLAETQKYPQQRQRGFEVSLRKASNQTIRNKNY